MRVENVASLSRGDESGRQALQIWMLCSYAEHLVVFSLLGKSSRQHLLPSVIDEGSLRYRRGPLTLLSESRDLVAVSRVPAVRSPRATQTIDELLSSLGE